MRDRARVIAQVTPRYYYATRAFHRPWYYARGTLVGRSWKLNRSSPSSRVGSRLTRRRRATPSARRRSATRVISPRRAPPRRRTLPPLPDISSPPPRFRPMSRPVGTPPAPRWSTTARPGASFEWRRDRRRTRWSDSETRTFARAPPPRPTPCVYPPPTPASCPDPAVHPAPWTIPRPCRNIPSAPTRTASRISRTRRRETSSRRDFRARPSTTIPTEKIVYSRAKWRGGIHRRPRRGALDCERGGHHGSMGCRVCA